MPRTPEMNRRMTEIAREVADARARMTPEERERENRLREVVGLRYISYIAEQQCAANQRECLKGLRYHG